MTEAEWTPKNGERVWIKVFSNWSLGTYIGFDTIENKHLVREDADGGGHLMASSQVLPEDANPNASKELPTVEWIAEKVRHNPLMSSSDYNKLLEEAKETEKKRLEDAYNAGIWDVGCRAPNFDEYYKRTFKSE